MSRWRWLSNLRRKPVEVGRGTTPPAVAVADPDPDWNAPTALYDRPLTRGQQHRAGPAHTPRRPQWTCTACDADWPCAPAKVSLLEEYCGDRVGLSVYMASQYHHAAGELAHITPTDIYGRFFRWLR